MNHFDRSKSLQELEGKNWGEPNYSSYLVTTCHALRRKPINEFSIEDLRIMIGQSISLPFLITVALEKLAENPLASGDYYAGDLLKIVLSVDPAFWQENPELYWKANEILNEVKGLKKTLEAEILPAGEKFECIDMYSK